MTIQIEGRLIGPGQPTYIVAEVSANHQQDYEQAVRIVRAAKEAGADAIKLQTYTADTLTLRSDKEWFRVGKGTLWEGRTLHDLYEEAHMPWEWQPSLKKLANELGMHLFSTPFDGTSIDFLDRMGVPAYKVASFELVDIPLVKAIAAKGKPVIMSTGMASLAEIEEAVSAARSVGCHELVLLKCTSAYPAPPDEMNLRTIPHLAQTFGVPTGLSDHTLGIEVPVAAVALGACVIEKHLTIRRAAGGPDSAFSLEPDEFRAMVSAVRQTERALGRVSYETGLEEGKSRGFRRSLFIVRPVKAGEPLTAEHVRSIRPANGLHPRHLPDVLGRRASRDIDAGTPLAWEHVAEAGR